MPWSQLLSVSLPSVLLAMCLSASLCVAEQVEQVEQAEQIAVIVAKTHTTQTLSRADLARIYQRRQRFWNNGAKIVPFNLAAEHPIRRQFSVYIFNRSPEDMQDYWDTQYFHGVSPPYALASEEAVIQFVASTPGAIGYVPANIVNEVNGFNQQVKVLMLLPLSATQ